MLKKSIIFYLSLITCTSFYNNSHCFYFDNSIEYCNDDLDSPYNIETEASIVIKEAKIKKEIKQFAEKTIDNIKLKASQEITQKSAKKFNIKKIALLTLAGAISINEIIAFLTEKPEITEEASINTKELIINLASKLQIKNPKSISATINSDSNFLAYATPGGNICINKKLDNTIDKNSQFILGHELMHIKNKHFLKRSIIDISSSIITFIAYKKLQKCKNFTAKLASFSIFTIPIIIRYFVSKYFEKEADLGAASLGLSIALEGIRLYKHNLSHHGESTTLQSIFDIILQILQAHPSNLEAIDYLRKYITDSYK